MIMHISEPGNSALPPADVEGVGIVKQAFELASSDQKLIEFLTSTGCFGNLVGKE
jgi:hypothetical protein